MTSSSPAARAKHNRAYYEKNRSRYQDRNRRYRERNQAIALEHLRTHPCVDCGETDPVVLEFDHVRGKKAKLVTAIVRNGLAVQTLLDEIAKCDVRCANCHRRRTFQATGAWKLG